MKAKAHSWCVCIGVLKNKHNKSTRKKNQQQQPKQQIVLRTEARAATTITTTPNESVKSSPTRARSSGSSASPVCIRNSCASVRRCLAVWVSRVDSSELGCCRRSSGHRSALLSSMGIRSGTRIPWRNSRVRLVLFRGLELKKIKSTSSRYLNLKVLSERARNPLA